MNEDRPFHDNPDLIRALEDAPPRGDIAVPDHILFQLERVLLESTQTASAPLSQPTRPSIVARQSKLLLRVAASIALVGIVTYFALTPRTPTAQVTMLSPIGEAVDSKPFIAWDARDEPGQKYDVWILPAEGDYLTAPTLYKAEGVTSPVSFSDLKPGPEVAENELRGDTEYRVLVCLADAGRTAGVPFVFKVKPRASAP